VRLPLHVRPYGKDRPRRRGRQRDRRGKRPRPRGLRGRGVRGRRRRRGRRGDGGRHQGGRREGRRARVGHAGLQERRGDSGEDRGPRRAGQHAERQRQETPAGDHGRGVRQDRGPEPQGDFPVVPGVRKGHGRSGVGEHHRVLEHQGSGRRAGAGGLCRDQVRDRADAAGSGGGARASGGAGQRYRARDSGDAAYRPDQGLPRLVRRLREQEHPRPVGAAARDGRDGGLPRLRRQLLRHRGLHARGRGLDRRRRALHAAAV
ncbi:MAG: 3-oxoacyl-[acyl-carrier protein] reductase, partial [uncultured Rubrobacteraceae bacterium]